MTISVKMIAPFHTGREINVLYTAARTCYSEETPNNIYHETFDKSQEDMIKLIKKVLDSGHLSVAEHINFTFAISGISRACSHQLVRHRHASYSQKSQRYVKEGSFEYVTPNSVKETIDDFGYDAVEVYDYIMSKIRESYQKLLSMGIPPEDARMVLPNACETSLTMTLNLREMIHLCNLRLCTHAQFEIQELVTLMRKEILDNTGEFGKMVAGLLVPSCKSCNDFRPCARRKAGQEQK